jgi:hypothetical protein
MVSLGGGRKATVTARGSAVASGYEIDLKMERARRSEEIERRVRQSGSRVRTDAPASSSSKYKYQICSRITSHRFTKVSVHLVKKTRIMHRTVAIATRKETMSFRRRVRTRMQITPYYTHIHLLQAVATLVELRAMLTTW